MVNDNRIIFRGIPRIDITLNDGRTLVEINKEEKFNAAMVTTNANGSAFAGAELVSGPITIKGRGNTTWGFPKKPFNIVTTDNAYKKKKTTPFGMPSHSGWCLLAEYQDKVHMRTPVTTALSYAMGLPWASRTQKVELYINGEYLGLYTFCEKVEADVNRIPVIVTNGVDTGWTIEQMPQNQIGEDEVFFQDERGYWFSYKAPESDKPAPAQNISIRDQYNDLMDRIYEVPLDDLVNGYRGVMNVESFAMFFLLQDICKNYDAFVSSWYTTRRTSTALIEAGPFWDANGVFGLLNTSSGPTVGFPSPYGDFLINRVPYYAKLMTDPYFAGIVKGTFNAVLPAIHQVFQDLINFFPLMEATGAIARDRAKWPEVLEIPDLFPLPSFEAEKERFLSFIGERIFWTTRFVYDQIPPKPLIIP